MLTTTSQFGPRARSLRPNHATVTATVHRVLSASGALTLQQCQQTRDFRFGSWFSHLESEIQEKIRRHEQNAKQRYLDLGQHSEWEKHPGMGDTRQARRAVKRMMASYWISHDARPYGRHDNTQSSEQPIPDDQDGMRPGQNIEDVERGAMEHLISGTAKAGTARRPNLKQKLCGKKSKHYSDPRNYYDPIPEDKEDYFIDPVTNRRVAKNPATKIPEGGVDIPVKTFQDYRKRCNTSSAAPSDKTCLNKLRKASQVDVDPNTEHPGGDSGSPEKPLHGNLSYNGNAGDQDTKFKSDDLHKQMPVLEDIQALSKPPEQPCNDLDKYKPVLDDKKPTPGIQFEDLKPPHEDLDTYNEAVVDEILTRFESGKILGSDLQRYDQEFEPEHSSERDVEPKHNLHKLRPDSSFDATAKRTEDHLPRELNSYRPVKAETQEKPLGPQIPSINIGSSAEHQPLIEKLEPGDFPPSTVERLREKYGKAELRKYTVIGHANPEQNALSSAEETVVEHLSKRYDPEESAKHGPVYWNKPDDPAEPEYYQKPVYGSEPDVQISATAEDSNKCKTGLEEWDAKVDYRQPVYWNEPDGLPTAAAEDPSKSKAASNVWDQAKVDQFCQLMSGNVDRADESSNEALRKTAKIQQIDQDSMDDFDFTRRSSLMLQMKKHQAASDATDHEASLAIKHLRARFAEAESKGQLTGNYVQDFPEEFERSWTETLSTAPAETAQPSEDFQFESQNMDGGLEGAFGRPSPVKIQPALDRHLNDKSHMEKTTQGTGNEDSGPKSAQDSPDMRIKESGETLTSPAHNKRHEDISGIPSKGVDPTKLDAIHHESPNEPTLYKILAYDPTMQKIEIAETSSFVPDTASALTPADALLRLSHPTRFFPHFGPLQAEGYEIISGAGDVLVFRKVRPEISRGKAAEQATVTDQSVPTEDESGAVETRINPIDMTGMPRFSPASANFASPTGYVNYENIPDTAASKLPPPPPPPRIKYNIDVHREEPVFSGPKERIDGKGGKKKGLGKRLVVGGVWVAGVSYALGVISEYL
jgi:hypothetical protein